MKWRFILGFLPYVAVLVGLYVCKSPWLTLLLYHGGIFLVLLFMHKFSLVKELFAGWNGTKGAWCILLGLSAGGAFLVLLPFLGLAESLPRVMGGFSLTGVSFFAWSLYFFIVNPFFEEVFWRGVLGDKSKWPVVQDVLFAGYHSLVLIFFIPWGFALFAILPIAFASWVWRQVYRREQGLLIPVVSHLAADISVMAVAAILLI